MQVAAIYARYSTDDQKPTSIDDQVRQCQQAAEKMGFKIDERWVFSDSAISGGHKGSGKRAAFERLLDAIEAKQIDVLFVDEVSRVARNELDAARVSTAVDRIGLRLVVVSDHLDTQTDENWKVIWGIKLIVAVQQNASTAKEVIRGMLGALERGKMIAQTPIGYIAERCMGTGGGTVWHIDEPTAKVVRQLYEWRHQGVSLLRIAMRLNEQGIPCPGAKRCKGDAYWRPATVARVLKNQVYKGVFVWNGSDHTKAKARLRNKQVHTIDYPRPHLRLVSDDIWAACNGSVGKERVRGGGKHALAGVIRCGRCKARLCLGSGTQVISAYCPQCAQAKAVNKAPYFVGYTTLKAVQLALEWGVRKVFTGAAQAEFHERLRARLTNAPLEEIAHAERRMREAKFSMDRLGRLLSDPNTPHDWLGQQLTHFGHEHEQAQRTLRDLKASMSLVTQEMIECQLEVDPLDFLEPILRGEPEVWAVRQVFKRLITRFEFVEKGRRGRSVFELAFSPGELVSHMSKGPLLDSAAVAFRIEVDKPPSSKTWAVTGARI
jgi:site-specific DNA recombinase